MNDNPNVDPSARAVDSGLLSLVAVASYYRIVGDLGRLERELNLGGRASNVQDLLRGAKLLGLKARLVSGLGKSRLQTIPLPTILRATDGSFVILAARAAAAGEDGHAETMRFRVVDPVTKVFRDLDSAGILAEVGPFAILITRRIGGEGIDPKTFGLRWFLPSIWRYRVPLGNALLASLFIQLFGLISPLFFQVVVDKVLAHRSYSTLYVLSIGLVALGLFDVTLQFMRTYVLSHTTNRIDVELGRRLFGHLLRLPISYFETRAAGQTVARLRELETVRTFLTGQALFSALDLAFAFVFVGVLFAYSWKMTLVVLASIPFYLALGFGIRPLLRARTKERFDRGAASQQFLVEAVVGMTTIKASAVEPSMRAQWEEKLAAYVRTGFEVTVLGAMGQNAVQYVYKVTNALILLFGAYAVMDNELSIGALVAFNMLAAQAVQPILRLSQLWQDFQQVLIAVDRLGDVLNVQPERSQVPASGSLGRPRGHVVFDHVTFRYRQNESEVLKDVNIEIQPGEVIGIVGPSGSGKSTLTKLLQRLYVPEYGRILVDGSDVAQVDPSWLRSNVGVVLQDSVLFNRSVHDNIAFANPGLPRSHVVAAARLTGADEFITKLPDGYDSMVEERGANLSGGQRQRLAIARALVTNPPILILDEATSALDYESERLIRQNMARIAKGRTVVVVAHRLSAVRRCDRIYGIAGGRVVEVGTHEELKTNGGLYARLLSMQNEDDHVG